MKLKQRILVLCLSSFVIGFMYILLSTIHDDNLLKEAVEGSRKKSSKKMSAALIPQNKIHVSQVEKVENNFVAKELKRLRLDFQSVNNTAIAEPFKIAASWVNERQIYPHVHFELAAILKRMATQKIILADVLPKGTQIKLLLQLEGGQRVVFKQKRYERDSVINGKAYDGYDRHNAEIAAFHLDRIMDFRRSPLVVGRQINLKTEIKPVATERLLKTFRINGSDICYFGMCLYCKEENMACAKEEVMEGALTLWLPEEWSNFVKQRHPYQRTYVDGRSAKWEVDETYCDDFVKHQSPYNKGPRLLDITDGAVFDYIIGNADRHHYETFKDKGANAMMLMLDNAKSFGNPLLHEPSILAPLRQCCIIRNSTWVKLHELSGGVLKELIEAAMESDPISPILHPSHLHAMDVRLPRIIGTIDHCIKQRGKDKVIINHWNGL